MLMIVHRLELSKSNSPSSTQSALSVLGFVLVLQRYLVDLLKHAAGRLISSQVNGAEHLQKGRWQLTTSMNRM